MLETLSNLKNNKTKTKTNTGAQHQGGDALERMKKFIAALEKRRHGADTLFFSKAKPFDLSIDISDGT